MIKAIVNPDAQEIKVSAETHRELGAPTAIELCFGQLRKELPITVDSVADGTAIVPGYLSSKVSIPDLPYQARWQEGKLHLGPVIGFMNNPIFFENPHWIASRFERYSDYQGLIFIFAMKYVDIKNKLIRGKYYNPVSQDFVDAILPYPAAVYFRTNPTPQLYRHFKNLLGEDKLYNYPYRSNKWVFWNLARNYPQLHRHLPETREFNTLEDVLDMLGKYSTVYIKPYDLSRGRGIFRLAKENKRYTLKDSTGHLWSANSDSILEQLLQNLPRREYLIQQEIFFYHQGHKADFRVYLQKNGTKEWKYKWLEMKLAIKGSIISNFSNRYELVPGEEALQTVFGLGGGEMRQKIDEITRISIQGLGALEDNGHHLGDVALDLVLDRDLKVWLLEVQPDYYSDVFRVDFQKVHMHPDSFEYVKALAGF